MPYHVIPDNDTMEHTPTEWCPCYPRAEDCGVVVHNAKDVREARERLGYPTDNYWLIVHEA